MSKMTAAVLVAGLAMATQAMAADAPAEIKIGTLYASSGRFASISMPVYSALKLWADQKNADGGVYVKAFDKKIPVKLVAYDDQSNTATASTLYNQLVTQDKVDLLVADSGSVLTAPAATIARDHKMFLFDQTGTGASFFSKENPYIALMSDPVSTIWPKPVADFISHDGPGLGIKKIAILYSTNEFTGTQANAFRKFVKDSGAPIEIVYDQGVPTETTNYTVIINNINNTQPDAVLHFGYAPNDIAFLRNVQDVGIKFKMMFCIYPGLETELLEKNVGVKGLEHIFTYVPPSELDYQVNFGMNMKDYKAAWDKAYSDGKVEFGFNAVAGYTTGLVIEKTLSVASSLDQLELRRANFSLSGELKTLDGTYALDEMGGQIGELTPLGQLELDDKNPEKLKFISIYPHETATGKPVYPRP
jgi:branched-chain amino acid transport system substrate-binding protein